MDPLDSAVRTLNQTTRFVDSMTMFCWVFAISMIVVGIIAAVLRSVKEEEKQEIEDMKNEMIRKEYDEFKRRQATQ